MSLFSRILRAGEGKNLELLEAFAAEVNAVEDRFTSLSDAELIAKTDEFRRTCSRCPAACTLL